MEIKGKIEAITKKQDGVKINDTWYNATEKTKDLIPDLKVGQEIAFESDDNKNIIYIKFNNKNARKQQDTRLEWQKENSKTITHMASLNSAIEFFKLREQKDVTKEEVVKTARCFEEEHIFRKKSKQAG